MLAAYLIHHLHVLDVGIILHDGAGVHNIAPILRHFFDDPHAELPYFLRSAPAQHRVRDAAADGELIVQTAMDLEDIVLIAVEDDAAIGQLAEGVEVMLPPALGVKKRLVAVLPELLDTGLERGPVVGLELFRVDERNTPAMHPVADGHLLVHIGSSQAHVD